MRHESPDLRRFSQRLRLRNSKASRILFLKSPLGPRATLAARALIVAVLFSVVLVVFYLDRDGLRDSADGRLSLLDVVYFTMVTVTSVGYGDIVPISASARTIDAFLVTPIRIFVWFIFLGTAYQLVVQRVIEDFRMQRLQRRLSNHYVICGFGTGGATTAIELVSKGNPADTIVVIDSDESRVRSAVECGYVGLLGDATNEELLQIAGLQQAKGLVIATGDDETSLMIVATARGLETRARIVTSVQRAENVKVLRNAGADGIVTPWVFGGFLLADALVHEHTSGVIQDALSHDGDVTLCERSPTQTEIGRAARELQHSLVLGIVRHGRRIMFWQEKDLRVEPGDRLIVLDAIAAGT